jgi:hypothetical protein
VQSSDGKTCIPIAQVSSDCTGSGGVWDASTNTCTCPQAKWYTGDPKQYPYSSYLLNGKCVDTPPNTFFYNGGLYDCTPDPGVGRTANAQGQCCEGLNCTTPSKISDICSGPGKTWAQSPTDGTFSCMISQRVIDSCNNSGGKWSSPSQSCSCAIGLTYNQTTFACDCQTGLVYNQNTQKCEGSRETIDACTNGGGKWDESTVTCQCPQAKWYKGDPAKYPYSSYFFNGKCIDTPKNTFYYNGALWYCKPDGKKKTANAQGQCCNRSNCFTPHKYQPL